LLRAAHLLRSMVARGEQSEVPRVANALGDQMSCRFIRLAVVIVIACPGTAVFGQDADSLRVATFCSDVTPPLGHPWYPDSKPLAAIEHPLLAKGIVIDDGKHRYVLCAVDWCELCNSTHLLFRRNLANAVGTDVSRVAVQTVHQHTALLADGDAHRLLQKQEKPPPYLDLKFLNQVTDRLAVAAGKSLDDLKPFDRIGTGQAKVERVASSRRIPIGGGKVRTRYSSTRDAELQAAPEGHIDPMLKTITFANGEKPLVRLHYYATHPQSFYRDQRASYDFPGLARERIEKKSGVFQIYFTGCAGDVAAGKYNDGSREARSKLAERLRAGLEASIASTRLAPVGPLCWRTVPLKMPVRTGSGYDVAENRAKMADAEAAAARRKDAARNLVFAERTEPIELSSLQIGDVYIVHLPGEPMVAFQLFAQGLKPKSFVAVAGYGDGCPGYICTEEAFSEGGYEPSASRVAPESEKDFRTAIRRLLGCR